LVVDPNNYPMSGKRFNQFIKKAVSAPKPPPAALPQDLAENAGFISLAFPVVEI
jgi:hypothetical protein